MTTYSATFQVGHMEALRRHLLRGEGMRPKVEVVARAITELGLGTRVVTKETGVGDPECRDALRSCDLVFSCTDDNDGRLFLNRLALFYLIPVIDLGLGDRSRRRRAA